MANATAVQAGTEHSCALLTTRHIACWGANGDHQLGDGGASPSTVPNEVSGIANGTSISSGYYDSCTIRAGGTVACWGRNTEGELGNGSTAPSMVPTAVSGLTDATQVATGLGHTCALRATGAVVCWGADFDGQLGDGSSNTSSSVPVAVSGITNAIAIDAGTLHTCAVLSSGGVTCWGSNTYGQDGDGSSGNAHGTPVMVSGITDATAVTAGNEHTCALRSGGAMACWGAGNNGEMGNGTNPAKQPTPVPVSNFP
jgi:alpha-tubulin suppressor-like RCC1 family protein